MRNCLKNSGNVILVIYSLLLHDRKNSPTGVSFSKFICTFAVSFGLFYYTCFRSTKVGEKSDMAKSLATYCCSGTYKMLAYSAAEIRSLNVCGKIQKQSLTILISTIS